MIQSLSFVRVFTLSCLTMLVSATLLAQPDYADIRFQDYIYVDYIKSVQLTQKGIPLSNPVVGPKQRLALAFDDLNADDYEYSYTIIHCDRNWKPSDISPLEYLSGYESSDNIQLTFSQYTTIPYTHHALTLPNTEVGWTVSGNYLLVVYDQDNNPIITRRFIVHENLGTIVHELRKSNKPGKTFSHHQLYFHYEKIPATIDNPLLNIDVSVIQNGDWSTLQEAISPDNFNNNRLAFSTTKEVLFPSLIEFRVFDTRNLESRNDHVEYIQRSPDSIYVLMSLDKLRNNGNYATIQDINGKYVIDKKEVIGSSYNPNDRNFQPDDNANIFSEYSYNIFSIESEKPLDHPIYITGRFTDYQPYPEFEMIYDPGRKIYKRTILLKQGHYDFLYATLVDGKLEYDDTEQYLYEATQEYTYIVYYRNFADIFDRVLRVSSFD